MMCRTLGILALAGLLAAPLAAQDKTPADNPAQPAQPDQPAPQDQPQQQPAPTDPNAIAHETPAPPSAQPINAKVLTVKGKAEFRTDAQSPWQPLQVGQVLPVGTEIRTGLRSAVTILTGPNAYVDVMSMTNLVIGQNEIDRQKTIRTQLGKKYGRLRFNVREVGYKNDFRIASPSGVMAVKGTGGIVDGFTGDQIYGDPSNRPNSIHYTNQLSQFEIWLSANQQISQYFPTPERFIEFQQQVQPQLQNTLSTFEANLDSGQSISGGDILREHQKAIQQEDNQQQFDQIINPPDDDSGGENDGGQFQPGD